MEIKRDFYLNKLIQHKQNGLVKIITGVRRSGKSYLLFKLFRNHLIENGVAPDHIISIALDDYENKPTHYINTLKTVYRMKTIIIFCLTKYSWLTTLKALSTAFCIFLTPIFTLRGATPNFYPAI